MTNWDGLLTIAWICVGAVFCLVFALWSMGILLWYIKRRSQYNKLNERLGHSNINTIKKDGRVIRLWKDGSILATVVPGDERPGLIERIKRAHAELGVSAPLSTFVFLIVGLISFIFLIVLMLSQDLLMSFCAAGFVILMLWILLNNRRMKQTKVFDMQLIDALGLAARSLRSGQPLMSALKIVEEEMEPPICDLFGEALQEQSLGMTMEDALRGMANKGNTSDLKLFAAATIIQLRSGGNLADMMDRLSWVIRDRVRLHRRARILTAQAQLSKRILMAVPFFTFGSLYVINREYISLLYKTDMGRWMLLTGLVLFGMGSYIMNRMSIIKY